MLWNLLKFGALVLVGFLVLAYLGLCVMLYMKQRDMMYARSRSAPVPAEQIGLEGARLVNVTAADGTTLSGYFRAADPGKPIIIYFHGNGGDITRFAPDLSAFGKQGFGYLGLSYRGFGASEGETSEANLISDAATAYDWLAGQGVPKQHIALVGVSLGTGVATQLAAKRPVASVALVAPYTATVDVAAERFPFLPVRWLMRDQFRSRDYIARINAPLLIIHGKLDKTIPYHFGDELFALAAQPKTFIAYELAGHEVIGQAQPQQNIMEFLLAAQGQDQP